MLSRYLLAVLFCLAAVVVLGLPATAGAKTIDCANVQVGKKAPMIVGSNVRATHVGCKRARALLRKYFNEVLDTAQEAGGCAQVRGTGGPGCYIDGYRCTARDGESTIRGRCTSGKGKKRKSIRFDEYDSGPA